MLHLADPPLFYCSHTQVSLWGPVSTIKNKKKRKRTGREGKSKWSCCLQKSLQFIFITSLVKQPTNRLKQQEAAHFYRSTAKTRTVLHHLSWTSGVPTAPQMQGRKKLVMSPTLSRQILASPFSSKEQVAYLAAPRGTDIVYPPLLSSGLKQHSLLSHSSHRSYSISMVTLSYLLPSSEPFSALIYPLEMRGTAHGNQSARES